MKFVELTTPQGTVVCINPAFVMAVGPWPANRNNCYVIINGSPESQEFLGSYDAVVRNLERAS